jgi:HK97 family phage major capsid protein
MPQNRPHNVEPQNQRRTPRIETLEDKGKWGFRDFGEFAASVAHANPRVSGSIDPRLRDIRNAPTTYGNEGSGADGGFAVPPDFRSTIMEKVMAEESLMSRTDQMTTSSNHITLPKDETTPWQTSGGFQVYWEGENDQLTQSKPQLKEETIKLNKLTALVPVTEELLSDAPSLDSYLRRKVPEKMDFAINLAIIQGTGVGKPKGILNADCLVSVAKDSSTSPVQPADTIRYKNIVAMWNRLYAPLRRNAVWLVNQDIETQLQQMEFPTTTGASAVPAYMPPGGLSQAPYGTLMGRPVIATQACETLGDQGDIILSDLSQYITVMKTGGVRSDVSIHLWFDYDTVAFRFIMRIGGQPWWGSAIDPRDGSTTYSCFVTLDERA